MKKLSLSLILSLFVCIHVLAQNLQTISIQGIDKSKLELKLTNDWSYNLINNQLTVSEGTVSNLTNQTLKDLNLKLFLAPTDVKQSKSSIMAFPAAEASIKKLKSKENRTDIQLKTPETLKVTDGNYEIHLVLFNKSGKVLDYVNTHKKVNFQNGKWVEGVKEGISKTENQPKTNYKLEVKAEKLLKFEKEWKFETKFDSNQIKLTGGSVANYGNNPVSDLVINVFLTKERENSIHSDFKGILIASAQLGELNASSRADVQQITTNLIQHATKGEYYILMTLGVIGENGSYQIYDTRSFETKVAF